ncbi:MAG: hypothetical protein ACP5KN_07590, partial [Armatimonadota bacterium]
MRGLLLALPVILLCAGVVVSAPEGFEVLAPTSGVEPPEGVEPEPLTYPSAWEPGRADLQRGFTAGVVDTAESLTPDWLWPEPEPAQRIDLFGCRGQYLAVSIAVRALRPVREMRVVARALRGPAGQIAPEHIDLRWVQYLPEQDQDRWVWRGRWLEQALPRDLPGEHTAWLWMTVHVPDRTAAGLYSGELTIEDADGATLALPLHLRVLDVELQRPEGSYGFYMPGHLYSDRREGLHNYASEHLTAENLTPYFRFWRTRGLNSPTLFHIYPELSCVDGHAIGDFPQVRKFVRAMREAGIDGDLCLDLRFLEFWCNVAGEELARRRAEGASIAGDLGVAIGEGRGMLEPPDEAKRLFRELVEQLVAAAEAEDWPRTLLIADEEVANTDMKAATYDQYMPVILDVAPQRALLVDNAIGYGRPDAIDRGCRDGIPYRQYNNWTEEGLQCAREAGDEVRTYNYGWERSAWGLYQHFVGSAGNHQWADHWTSTTGPGWINTLITKQGVVSQPRLERIREGLDDLSYCRTLQRLASRLREAGRAAAADRAEEVLDEVVADLPVNRLDLRDWQQATPTAELDRRRWRVALAALQARRELGEDVVAPVGAAPGRPRLRGVASRREGEE